MVAYFVSRHNWQRGSPSCKRIRFCRAEVQVPAESYFGTRVLVLPSALCTDHILFLSRGCIYLPNFLVWIWHGLLCTGTITIDCVSACSHVHAYLNTVAIKQRVNNYYYFVSLFEDYIRLHVCHDVYHRIYIDPSGRSRSSWSAVLQRRIAELSAALQRNYEKCAHVLKERFKVVFDRNMAHIDLLLRSKIRLDWWIVT